MNIIIIAMYPIMDTVFHLRCTTRLWRAGYPLVAAWHYSRNR